ncbi:MAG: gamma carbonic anhydrase family protein [Actinomycetota bacterium]|nr:gamma carbonic anhydrase family protein [Actinomycetota bacterium]
MPLFELDGKRPQIAPTAFIAATASIIGDVVVEDGASVWYGAVVRGDFDRILIRAGANVQDGSVIHGPPGAPIEIGAGATVGHLCVIHGASLGEEALVANGSTVLDGARVGPRAMVGAGALVPPGMVIPEGMLALGMPAKIKGPLEGTPAQMWVEVNPRAYQELAQRYRNGVRDYYG